MITLNYRDSKPIYEQIKDAIRRLIFSGGLQENERIPSVREFALELSINPNTVQRAYRELEAEGCIYSVPGKGSFVRKAAQLTEARKQELLHSMDAALSELQLLGARTEEICAYISEVMKGGD